MQNNQARWVVMGVSGCGKSSVGAQLAEVVDARLCQHRLRFRPEAVEL